VVERLVKVEKKLRVFGRAVFCRILRFIFEMVATETKDVTSAAKAAPEKSNFGTAKAVPLSTAHPEILVSFLK
jgi:hypothetical protein